MPARPWLAKATGKVKGVASPLLRPWVRITALSLATAVAMVGAVTVAAAASRTLLIIAALAGVGGVWAELRQRGHGATISSIVFSGLAIVGLYLSLATGSDHDARTSRPPADPSQPSLSPLATGDIAQVRNESRRTPYGDPAVAAPGQVIRYRLRLSNTSEGEVKNLWVRLGVRDLGSYAVIAASFASTSVVRSWPTDTATVNYADARQLAIEKQSARLTEKDGTLIRRLPIGIDQAGVNVGDLGSHQTRYLVVEARTASDTQGTQAQIERGDILLAKNLSRGGKDFEDPVLAGMGDRLLLRFRLHNPNRALSSADVRARLSKARATFTEVRVTASSEETFPRSSGDTVKINFAQGARLRVRVRYGTTEWCERYGHSDECPDASPPRPLDDGIDQGGIRIGPVGYKDLGDDCSETIAYVDFQVRVMR